MLEYNEIKPKKFIVLDGAPYEVLTSHVFRKQQRKPVNATKLKNLITGKVTEYSFHVSDKAEEADLQTRTVKYLYKKPGLPAGRQGEWWFCDPKNPADRFELPDEIVSDQGPYLKINSLADVLSFGDKILGLRLPIKVELKVTEAAPAVKGNTAQGGLKQVKVETGLVLNVPMFINEGDVLRINTESGEYTERV